MTDKNETESDNVGYKNPPKFSQFKKGASGNPGGRPKGAKNMKSMIYDLGSEKITTSTQDGPKEMTLQEAVVRKFWELMLKKGDRQLYQLYMGIEKEVERERAEKAEKLKAFSKVEIVRSILDELRGELPENCINIYTIHDDEIREHVLAVYDEQKAERAAKEKELNEAM